MKRIIVIASAVVSGLLMSTLLASENFRCGDKLAFVGDSTYTVKSICGDPDDTHHHTETKKVSRRVSEPCPTGSHETVCSSTVEDSYSIEVDEWIYDFGSSRFIETLRFEDGKLANITDGGYGHKSTN